MYFLAHLTVLTGNLEHTEKYTRLSETKLSICNNCHKDLHTIRLRFMMPLTI